MILFKIYFILKQKDSKRHTFSYDNREKYSLKIFNFNFIPNASSILMVQIIDSSSYFHTSVWNLITSVANTMVGLTWLFNKHLWNRNEMKQVVIMFWSHEWSEGIYNFP